VVECLERDTPSPNTLPLMSRSWKLTVRNGSNVEHAQFDDLAEAVAAMRERALAIRAEAPAQPVRSLRDFEPKDQVLARLQLSGGRLFGRRWRGWTCGGTGRSSLSRAA
jgi:hypothetical protein